MLDHVRHQKTPPSFNGGRSTPWKLRPGLGSSQQIQSRVAGGWVKVGLTKILMPS